MHNNKSMMANKCTSFAGPFDDLAIHQCNTKHITQWRMPWATIEATGRRHWETIHIVLPRWRPGSSVYHTHQGCGGENGTSKASSKKAQNGPSTSTHVIDAASFVKLWHCTIGSEELSYFLAIRHWQRTKIGELTKHQRRSWPPLGIKLLSC